MSKNWEKKTWMSIHLCSSIFSLLRHLPKYLPIINEKRTMMNELQLLIEMWIMMDELCPTNFSLSLSLSLHSFLFFSFPLINSYYVQCILTLLDIGWTHLWINPLNYCGRLGLSHVRPLSLNFPSLQAIQAWNKVVGGLATCYVLRYELWKWKLILSKWLKFRSFGR